ncbi:response regulator transcription factor [Paenarthrobacter sp. Z7-10]|uniref:response regulator transcription factor n=1 Tax=Paenarthrobacter sp. Z7-10 TaxID=2787635 RepID=UPI0022A951EA|nr:response regulator transcription factor [Paenarthrobacter sp. Z7-10]MCZ2401635.1 response regulator transcription factor [Paenarthrobacter sp. Z7-10]
MSTDNERPSLLLVEDDAVLGPLIAELLEDDYRVQLAGDGQKGLHLGLTGGWDVMVIDRGLPVLDGVSLIAALRRKGIVTPALILTASGTIEEKVSGLDAGANDYVTKPFDAAELRARLRALIRTYAAASGALTVGEWEFDAASRSARSSYGRRVSLTAKESELLAVLAGEPDRVFGRDELVRTLFHPTDHPGVIDTYVHYLRRKISKTIVRTVHGVGYQIGDPSA